MNERAKISLRVLSDRAPRSVLSIEADRAWRDHHGDTYGSMFDRFLDEAETVVLANNVDGARCDICLDINGADATTFAIPTRLCAFAWENGLEIIINFND